SRTFPLPTWSAASGMDGYLLLDEGVQAVEDGVDVPDGRVQVEDGLEIHAPGDLGVAADQSGEIRLLFPGTHRMALDKPVRIVAREARIDERQQKPMAEDESVTRLEVPAHSFGIDDEAVDDPGEAVEHVVEREKGVGNDD